MKMTQFIFDAFIDQALDASNLVASVAIREALIEAGYNPENVILGLKGRIRLDAPRGVGRPFAVRLNERSDAALVKLSSMTHLSRNECCALALEYFLLLKGCIGPLPRAWDKVPQLPLEEEQERDPQICSWAFDESIDQMFDAHHLSATAIIRQSLIDARDEPLLLHVAMLRRVEVNQPAKRGRQRGTRMDGHSMMLIDRLRVMTHLSSQEVVRLAVEAYLYKLKPLHARTTPRALTGSAPSVPI